MLVLAMESSTSSAKALLYDTEKGVTDSAQESYASSINQDGKTDTEQVYQITLRIARKIASGKNVAAIALCGTWHGISVCTEHMEAVTPTFSWNFTETASDCERIRQDRKLTERLYRNTGCMPHNTYPRHVIAWLREQGMYLEDKRFVTQGGYNFFHLTGEFLESICTQSGTGLINLRTLDYDPFTMDYFGIRRDQVGTLGSYWDARPLNEKGAKALGVRPGIPVVPAYADGALNQIGDGANKSGIMTMSVGTSGAIRMAVDSPARQKKENLWCYYGTDKWIMGAAVAGACNCVDWFMTKVLNGKYGFQDLETKGDFTKDVPVFLPFLYGERCPGWHDSRRGGFQFLESTHSLTDLYRGIEMGVLFNLYQCYQILCQEGRRPDQLILSGGITNSSSWTQMVADIFERDILVSDCKDASAMGAAILALYAAGELKDINQFQGTRRSTTEVKCHPERFLYYKKQYGRYLEAYQESSCDVLSTEKDKGKEEKADETLRRGNKGSACLGESGVHNAAL